MFWWYIADAVGAVVFLPALIFSLHKLIGPLRTLDEHLRAIASDSVHITASLDGIAGLSETQMLTGAGLPGIVRISDALEGAL